MYMAYYNVMLHVPISLLTKHESSVVSDCINIRNPLTIQLLRKIKWIMELRTCATNNLLHTNLSVLSIACFPCAQLIFIRETNTENSKQIAICSFHVHVSFDQSLPFLHH